MTQVSGPASRFTRQTQLALVAACAFVVLALLIAVAPVPYVVYSPGRTYDVLGRNEQGQPLLSIQGVTTYPTHGRLHMTTVAVTRADATTRLPEAVFAYWMPKRDALPRAAVYDPGKSSEQVRAQERLMMDTSQQDAVVAAFRAAGQPVEEQPVVSRVTVSGPAHGRLQPADLILVVDDTRTPTPARVREAIQRRAVGDTVRLTVERDRRATQVDVTTSPGHQDPEVPVLGIEIGIGYRYTPTVQFGIIGDVGGPSAGLVFAIALYDQLTPVDLLGGRSVAGTGEIDPEGRVGSIGGLQEKIASAEGSEATVFLVPAGNCRDLAGLQTSMELIRVDTLADALTGLGNLDDPTNADKVPRC